MSSPYGGGRRRGEAERAAASRSTRMHYARDVNDERALADDRPTIRRSRHWTWLAVAIVAMSVLAVVGGRGAEDVPITADCDAPQIAVASSVVTAGQPLRFRVTGAEDVDYVMTLDGEPVRGDAGTTVSYTETPAGPAFRLPQCLSPTLRLAAPAGDGVHDLAMLRVAGDGTTEQVAAVPVTVTGTG
ncbi:hypothetical protein IN07_13435 [Modestobacter caceresii]|uniref:Uncharacterized protein n=1 Tax=Modestobacter caceresii TaxID=1522368 RepID=A0A098Y8M7_9ACTN|nr:hypothetical protein [Modestobacter caceresii]KGH46096.1 hypothetical protein IN07_13435 [Modestobacter caceresii]